MLGRRRSAGKRVGVPIPPDIANIFVVFFAPSSTLPDFQDLKTWLMGDLSSLFGEPLLSSIRDFCDNQLHVNLAQRDQLPAVPVSLLRYAGLDEVEERKLDASTLAIVIQAEHDGRPPRAGFWSALGIAVAAADKLGGTLFDPAANRVVRLPRLQRPLSHEGRIAVTEHILLPFSIGERGLGWMTTTGLVKFGLPELEIVDIPPGLDELARLMNATGQRLVDLLDASVQGGARPPALEVPDVLEVSIGDHEAANGRERSGSAVTRIGLQLVHGGAEDGPGFLRLVKPADARSSHGEWLFRAMDELLGSHQDLRNVKTSGREMQAAHRRAVAELGRARDRFGRGLAPGETLYVKHGFPAGDRGEEYMWIAVTSWSGTRLRGKLVNNARDSDLKAGLDIDLDEREIFDWMIQLAHGEHEGGYTSDVALMQGYTDAELGR